MTSSSTPLEDPLVQMMVGVLVSASIDGLLLDAPGSFDRTKGIYSNLMQAFIKGEQRLLGFLLQHLPIEGQVPAGSSWSRALHHWLSKPMGPLDLVQLVL